MNSIKSSILMRIRRKGRGSAFTAKDFLDIGTRGSVDVALSTLASAGTIRRVCRGVYDFPRNGELVDDLLAPDYDQVAQAIARNTGSRIQPTGAVAANLLGLSQQVPARIVYLTDGRSRIVKFGSQSITFKRTRPRDLLPPGKSALVIQALRFLGKEGITEDVMARLRSLLSPAERERLLKLARYSSDWIADTTRRLVSGGEDG